MIGSGVVEGSNRRIVTWCFQQSVMTFGQNLDAQAVLSLRAAEISSSQRWQALA
ncbi:MAG: hypothetical protein HC838_02505 [Spirulinaceae cyanobacterium RM2_2_10]|nr:hypothetical protein [Spirulinaceae cyanobacterium RM2_2_10]